MPRLGVRSDCAVCASRDPAGRGHAGTTSRRQRTSGPLPPVAPVTDPRVVEIARKQRTLLWIVAAHIILAFVSFCLHAAAGEGARVGLARAIAAVPLIGLEVYAVTIVVKLMRAMEQNTPLIVVTCICLFVPCLAFLLLLAVSAQATKALRAKGYHVGFIGLGPRDLR